MFAIKLKSTDIWAGKRNITWFIRDDADFHLRGTQPSSIEHYGVPLGRRCIFTTTDQMRRSLAMVSKVTVFAPSNAPISFLTNGANPGNFSHYEVHDLSNGSIHSLEDVFSKLI